MVIDFTYEVSCLQPKICVIIQPKKTSLKLSVRYYYSVDWTENETFNQNKWIDVACYLLIKSEIPGGFMSTTNFIEKINGKNIFFVDWHNPIIWAFSKVY